jgi:hypothetical protein
LPTGNKDWDDSGSKRERSRSVSAYHEEDRAKDLVYEDKVEEAKVEKKTTRYDVALQDIADRMEVDEEPHGPRAETPEEGEI